MQAKNAEHLIGCAESLIRYEINTEYSGNWTGDDH